MNVEPKRPRSITAESWINGINKNAKTTWQEWAMDRSEWEDIGVAYIQQWIETG